MNTSVAPTYTLEDVHSAYTDCKRACGSLFAKQVLKRNGYDYTHQVPENRRWLVISMFNLEAKKEHERKREAAKKGVNITVKIDTKVSDNSKHVIESITKAAKGSAEYLRYYRRGPVTVPTAGVLRFGATVVFYGGREGKVASVIGSEHHVRRLVVVMDDCTTRILNAVEVENEVDFIYHTGGPAFGAAVAHHQV